MGSQLRVLVPTEHARASFPILRLPTAFRLSHLLCTVLPSITYQAAADYDAFLVEWVLTSIIAGNGAASVGQPTPEEVADDFTACQTQTYLGHEALQQAHLPIRKYDLGLTNSNPIIGAAYVGCHDLILGRVITTSARGNHPFFLERLPDRPVASALLKELKTVNTNGKRSQIEEAVDSLWAVWRRRGPSMEREMDSTGRIGSRSRRRAGGRGGAIEHR